MNGWIKYFRDGSVEYGRDVDVDKGVASWSNGRLTGLESVTSTLGDKHLCISGAGEYWQSDDFEVEILDETTEPEMVVRRIQKLIKPGDLKIGLYQSENSFMIKVFTHVDVDASEYSDKSFEILPRNIDQWIVLEYDISSDGFKYYFSQERL